MIEIIRAILIEKIRNKTLYIICFLGIVIPTFLLLNGNITWDGERIDDFETLAPIAIVIVNFFACLFAILLSVNTIPTELERKTGDLILVRGIKFWQYIFSLTISNIFISLSSLLLLSIPLIILAFVKGSTNNLPGIIGCIVIIFFNIATLSAVTSFMSKYISSTITGFLGIIIYFLGIFHDTINTAIKVFDNIGCKVLQYILKLIPDIIQVQKQAGNILAGKDIDIHPLIAQMLYLYALLAIIIISSKRRWER